MIRVVHCGDLHLDSPFSSNLDREQRQNELILDFKKMMAACKSLRVDVLLVAGDLFDNPNPSEKCRREVISEFEDFEGRVFISPGNHDPFLEGSVYDKEVFPDNVHIFHKEKPSGQHFTVRGCRVCVYGYAFTSYSYASNPLTAIESPDPNELNIICAHGDIYSAESSYAPITPLSIAATQAHYVALAHVHKRSELTVSGKTAYGYCGSLSARDFGETGQKGCYFLEFSEELPSPPVKHSFIPIGQRRYEEAAVTLFDGMTADRAISSLDNELISQNCHVRLVLTGEHSSPDEVISGIKAGLGGRLTTLELINNCRKPPDYRALEQDPSIAGEFYRILKPQLSSDPNARLALRLGLLALSGEDPLNYK